VSVAHVYEIEISRTIYGVMSMDIAQGFNDYHHYDRLWM